MLSVNKDKIKTLSELSSIVGRYKKSGKTVGLITGCFDVVHIGHITLFQTAKRHVDILVVGVDNDKSVKLSKGKKRPINNVKNRAFFINSLKDIDYVFVLKDVFSFKDSTAHITLKKMTQKINPDILITNEKCDSFWQEKKDRAEELKIGYLNLVPKKIHSSTKIVEKLLSEL